MLVLLNHSGTDRHSEELSIAVMDTSILKLRIDTLGAEAYSFDMKELATLLGELGLTATETKLYLIGHNGTGKHKTALDYSRATGIKRPTVYHALFSLEEKGLMAERKISGKTFFIPAQPEELQKLTDRKKEILEKQALALQAFLPLLKKKSPGEVLPECVSFIGAEGVKTVFGHAFGAKDKKWLVIAPYNNFLRDHDPAFAEYYKKSRHYYGITARVLWEPDQTGGRMLSDIELKRLTPRIMPESMRGRFQSQFRIFDDKIMIVSPAKDPFALLITSRDISEMFRAMFETIWNVSTDYREFYGKRK